MIPEENGCDERPRGFSAAGDAACVWHVLDSALVELRGIRNALEGADLNELTEELEVLVERFEEAHGEAGDELAEATEGSD